MTKAEFINRLEAELGKLPKADADDAIAYYIEYIEEAGPEKEAETIARLGSPARIAAQIKSDYAVKQFNASAEQAANGQKKKGLSAVVWVILGIFAAPVAIPVAFAAGIFAIAVAVTIIALAVAALCAIAAMFAAGIAMIVAGIGIITADIVSSITMIGLGLACTGGMLLAGVAVVLAVRAIFRFGMRKMDERRQRKAMEKKDGGRENE